MDVGIRELKRRLSDYLAGRIIGVTDRGKPKALLVPLPGRVELDRGIAAGWVRQGDATEPARARRRSPSRLRSTDVITEDRDD